MVWNQDLTQSELGQQIRNMTVAQREVEIKPHRALNGRGWFRHARCLSRTRPSSRARSSRFFTDERPHRRPPACDAAKGDAGFGGRQTVLLRSSTRDKAAAVIDHFQAATASPIPGA